MKNAGRRVYFQGTGRQLITFLNIYRPFFLQIQQISIKLFSRAMTTSTAIFGTASVNQLGKFNK